MRLSIPFNAKEEYIQFIAKQPSCFSSLYFPLDIDWNLSARLRFDQTNLADSIKSLSRVTGIKKYCLLNTRFLDAGLYHDQSFLKRLLSSLEALYSSDNLNGIVFNDYYLLNALAEKKASFMRRIEAVPGANSMIDSVPKASAVLELIENSPFRMPGKLIADRSLNRDIKALEALAVFLKKNHPLIKLELLANEGCILHCPFKLSHDALIAYSNTGRTDDRTFKINSKKGCFPYFFNSPHAFLKSPFIRPEDIHHYSGYADSLKICGRTLGNRFLMNVISSYTDGFFNGNLFELMDASSWMADHFFLDNTKLGSGFLNRLPTVQTSAKRVKYALIFLKRLLHLCHLD